jgi:hypothetical protein
VNVTVTDLDTGRTATGTPLDVHRDMQTWYIDRATIDDLLTCDALMVAVLRGDQGQHDLAAHLGVTVDVHASSNGETP